MVRVVPIDRTTINLDFSGDSNDGGGDTDTQQPARMQLITGSVSFSCLYFGQIQVDNIRRELFPSTKSRYIQFYVIQKANRINTG